MEFYTNAPADYDSNSCGGGDYYQSPHYEDRFGEGLSTFCQAAVILGGAIPPLYKGIKMMRQGMQMLFNNKRRADKKKSNPEAE